MKVVILGPHPAYFSGSKLDFSNDKIVEHPSPWIINLSTALAKFSDIELHIITLSRNVRCSQSFSVENITYHFLKYYKERFRLLTLYQFDRLKIYRKISEIRPDILHSHGTEDIYSYAAVTSGYPCLVSLQGIVHKILSLQPHNLLIPLRFRKYFERYTLKRAKYINAKTPYAFHSVRHYLNNARISFIEDPISEVYFRTQNYEKENCILFVGTITRLKGIEDLIRAIQLLRTKIEDIKVKIIGFGGAHYCDYVRNCVKTNDLQSNIVFLGYKDSMEIAQELSNSCLLVSPSYIENCPNVICEAMAAGKPVVTTKAGGIPYLVTDYKTGFLVNVGDIKAIATKIEILLRNKVLRKTMGQNARKEAVRRFHSDIIAEKHIRLYEEIINNWRKNECIRYSYRP